MAALTPRKQYPFTLGDGTIAVFTEVMLQTTGGAGDTVDLPLVAGTTGSSPTCLKILSFNNADPSSYNLAAAGSGKQTLTITGTAGLIHTVVQFAPAGRVNSF